MANGELRSVRIARARRVDSEDLERFVAGLDDCWPTGAHQRSTVASGRRREG
jgi:hypothetical protein